MADARAIRAAFTEYKMIKTRSALQLIVEVPLEQQADVFNKLGYPLPGEERWVAIALLDPAAVTPSAAGRGDILGHCDAHWGLSSSYKRHSGSPPDQAERLRKSSGKTFDRDRNGKTFGRDGAIALSAPGRVLCGMAVHT